MTLAVNIILGLTLFATLVGFLALSIVSSRKVRPSRPKLRTDSAPAWTHGRQRSHRASLRSARA